MQGEGEAGRGEAGAPGRVWDRGAAESGEG